MTPPPHSENRFIPGAGRPGRVLNINGAGSGAVQDGQEQLDNSYVVAEWLKNTVRHNAIEYFNNFVGNAYGDLTHIKAIHTHAIDTTLKEIGIKDASMRAHLKMHIQMLKGPEQPVPEFMLFNLVTALIAEHASPDEVVYVFSVLHKVAKALLNDRDSWREVNQCCSNVSPNDLLNEILFRLRHYDASLQSDAKPMKEQQRAVDLKEPGALSRSISKNRKGKGMGQKMKDGLARKCKKLRSRKGAGSDADPKANADDLAALEPGQAKRRQRK